MTDGIDSTPDTPAKMLIAVGVGWTLLLSMAALHSEKSVLLVCAALGALAIVASIVAFAPQRLVDVLFLGFVALVALPIDKHFAYRPHVGGWPGLRVSAADLCLFGLIILALLGWLMGRVKNVLPTSILLLYGLLCIQYLLSAFVAPQAELSAFELASAVHALLIYTVVASLFRRSYLLPVLWIFVTQTTLHTVFAIAQWLTGRPVHLGWLGGPQKILEEALMTGTVQLRPSGLFDHPIVYADFLLIILPVLMAGIFSLSTIRWWGRVALLGSFFFGLCGMIATLSRGAWISFGVAMGAFFGLAAWHNLLSTQKLQSLLFGGLTVTLVIGLLFAPKIYERLTYSSAGNLKVRFELNAIAMSMISAKPITGIGLNNFIEVMEKYDPKNVMKYFPATVHNLYLLEGAEAGIPGLFLFLSLFFMILWTSVHQLPKISDHMLQWFVVSLIAGIVGFLVSQFSDFSHRLEPLRSIFWTNIGLLFGLLGVDRKQSSHKQAGISQ